MNFASVFGWLVGILTALPSLITGVESLWKSRPKSGPEKWVAVEQALSGSIEMVAQEVVKAVPNAQVDAVAAKVDTWAKAVNDLTVGLFNDLGLLESPAPTVPVPAANAS